MSLHKSSRGYITSPLRSAREGRSSPHNDYYYESSTKVTEKKNRYKNALKAS